MKFTLILKILDIIHDVLCPFFRDKDIKLKEKNKENSQK